MSMIKKQLVEARFNECAEATKNIRKILPKDRFFQKIDELGEARHHGLMHDLALRKLASYPLPGTDSQSVLLQIRWKEG